MLPKYINSSRGANDVGWSLAKVFLESSKKSVPSLTVIVVKNQLVGPTDALSASDNTTHPSRRMAEADGYISCRDLKNGMGTLADMLCW